MASAHRSLLLFTFMLATPAVALASEPGSAALISDDEPLGVVGGDFVQTCDWPTAVSMEGQCSGTLIHPQVVIYAAHCGPEFESVQFGEGIDPEHARSVPTDYCRFNDSFSLGDGNDWAYCVLSEPQTDIAVVPPLMGCEVDVLTPGTSVTVVGFGVSETGYGDKKEVHTQLNAIEGNEAFIGGDGQGSCNGDSGGPAFVQMPDTGSWRVFGITSHGSSADCADGSWFSLMHVGMPWFEFHSGFDLTPCHDSDGNWSPSPGCEGFPLAPAGSGGDWADGCDPGPLGPAESTCGDVFDAASDTDPPLLTFVSPDDESRLDSDPETGQAQVTIEIEADDGDGYGVDTLELRINDSSVPGGIRQVGPFRYSLVLPPGTYRFDATAFDHSGNRGDAETIYVGVDMDPEVPEPGDSSGGGSEGSGGTGDEDESGDPPEGTSGDDGETEDLAGADEDLGGCGCRSTGSSPGALLLGLLGVVVRRRRPG